MTTKQIAEVFSHEMHRVLKLNNWQWNFSDHGSYAFNKENGSTISGPLTRCFLIHEANRLMEASTSILSLSNIEKILQKGGYRLGNEAELAAYDPAGNRISGECFQWLIEHKIPQEITSKDDQFTDKYPAIEQFVGAHGADDVKRHFQIATHKPDWEMAIKTHIACGERKDLEGAFPDWAGCNPENHNWS